MKITILQGAFFPVPPIRGGAVEKIWYRVGQQFASLGHDVVHISRTFTGLENKERVNNVSYLRVPGYETPSSLIKLKLFDLLYTLRALKHIPKDTDVIVTNTFWSPFFLRGKRGKKVYVSVERVPQGQIRFYKHVGRLRGCSPAICEAIKKELSEDKHHLISYVPNPVPFDVFPQNIEREKIILFVGRLHPEKGLHVLIDAYCKLTKETTEQWKLVIVGPYKAEAGGGGEAYFNKLLKMSENKNIVFEGPVYENEILMKFYSRASIFCYPAQEGSGDAAPVSPREAMAFGCVPVVSQLECFDDIITNGVNGISFDHTAVNQPELLATAFNLLIDNTLLLKKISEEGKLIYSTFSTQAIAKKFITDFENFLS